jgi:hypothetical protein
MATVLDELVVSLKLDTSGFADGQRRALDAFAKLKQSAQTSTQSIGQTTAAGLHEYLGAIHKELQDVNIGLLAMAGQSRRTGEGIKGGADTGAIGLKNLATAATAAVAAIATVHATISGLADASGRAAQTTRAAWAANLDPRQLSAIQQYAFQEGNVDFGTTQATLTGFESKRQAYKAQGQYPEEFTQFAFWLGMSPAEAATLPMSELLSRVSQKLQADSLAGNGAQAQLIAS